MRDVCDAHSNVRSNRWRSRPQTLFGCPGAHLTCLSHPAAGWRYPATRRSLTETTITPLAATVPLPGGENNPYEYGCRASVQVRMSVRRGKETPWEEGRPPGEAVACRAGTSYLEFKVVRTARIAHPGEAPAEQTDMARCTRKKSLGVYHIRTDWGNGLDNARVMCSSCYAQSTSPTPPPATSLPPPFTSEVIEQALRRAGRQCECVLDSADRTR